MADEDSGGIVVEIFKLTNRIKAKMGRRKSDPEGFFDPKMIEEAERAIKEQCTNSAETIAAHLDLLQEIWAEMREMGDGPRRADLSQKVFTLSHEIKDIGSMCGHDLIADFAESLRDFIGKTKLSLEAQRVIVQAHLDAMLVIQGSDDENEKAILAGELMGAVQKAVEKYS